MDAFGFPPHLDSFKAMVARLVSDDRGPPLGIVQGQSRTQAIRGWPGIRDWPGDGGPFAESATGLGTIQKSKNYVSN